VRALPRRQAGVACANVDFRRDGHWREPEQTP